MPNFVHLSRPYYFSGRLLTDQDLNQEQTYFIEKFKRHNRSLHGFGIVSGLKVKTDSGKIKIGVGMALDCEGNEIIIPSEQVLPAPAVDRNVVFVTLKYSEHREGGVPSISSRVALVTEDHTEHGDGVIAPSEPSSIVESFELLFTTDNQNSGHRHLKARWLSCGKVHGLTLAKLSRGAMGWRVDRGYRTPTIK